MSTPTDDGYVIDLDAEAWDLVDEEDFDDEEDADESSDSLQPGTHFLNPEPDEKGTRLDKFVADHAPGLSRSFVQQLIDQGMVTVDGRAPKSKFKVTPGQMIQFEVPEPEVVGLEPEDIPLDIVFENSDVIVLNKPAGMVVHPAPGHPNGTLVNALLHHAPEINVGGTNRPGIIHRLDRDTSGLMVVVKTDRARTSLVEQWQARTVEKGYIALGHGELDVEEATIDAPIGRDTKDRKKMAAVQGGRSAITHLKVAERLSGATLFDVDLETGRTHQIRVHLAFIGHPIVGDTLYNKYGGRYGGHSESIVKRQFLHAAKLAFKLPDGNGVSFDAPLPSDLQTALDLARSL
ncbi:MAG: RluA family pseudouridine synthase [Thermomicrobiales bacterium]